MTRKLNLLLVLVLTLSLALTACGGGDDKSADTSAESTGDADKGKNLFATTCAACHGPNGEGVQGLGKPFTGSEFLKGKNDDDLLAFVKKGRPPGDPDNTTGVDMPPKGGNPALSDDDLRDIIAFLRTLQ
jgi:mono/diheme cytochrome c family protein